MGKRSVNDVVVAGLVSAVVATVVTSAGLSTAQDMPPPPPEGSTSQPMPPPMDGGSYQPPADGGSNYSPMPPPEGGYPTYPQQGSYPPQPNFGPGPNMGPWMNGPDGMHGAPGGMNFGPESGPSQRILDEAKRNNGRVFQDENGSWRWDGGGQQGNQGRGFGQGFQGGPNGGMGSFGKEGGFGPGGMGDMMRGGPGMGPGGPGGMGMSGGMGGGFGRRPEDQMRNIDMFLEQFGGEEENSICNPEMLAKLKKAEALLNKMITKFTKVVAKFTKIANDTSKKDSVRERAAGNAEKYELKTQEAEENLANIDEAKIVCDDSENVE